MVKSQTLLQIIATSTKLLRRNKFRVKMIMQNAKWKIPRRSRPVQLLLSPLYIEITTTSLFQGVLTNPFLCFNLSFSLPYCCTLFGRMDRLDRTLWFKILLLSILPLICSFMQMEFMKNSTGLISVCLSLPLYFFSTLLPCIVGYYVGWRSESDPPPELTKLFRGHKRTGKIIGALLLSLGNVGLDYFTEKSVACMLTFLFLAVYFLSILCCIQPCTDFGILELLLSACSIVALRRFGVLHFNSWLVVLACLLIDVIRYLLDPEREHQPPSAAVQGSELISVHGIEVASAGVGPSGLSLRIIRYFNPWLVVPACLLIDVIRYLLDPEREHRPPSGQLPRQLPREHQPPSGQPPSAAVEGSQTLNIVASNGTEENQAPMTETSNGIEEHSLSIQEGSMPLSVPLCMPIPLSMPWWEETEEDQEKAKVGEEIANEGEETKEDQVSMTETANAGEETLPSIRNPNIGGDGPIQASRPRKRRVNQFK